MKKAASNIKKETPLSISDAGKYSYEGLRAFLLAALSAMTLFLNGDANHVYGDHQIVSLFWLFFAGVSLCLVSMRQEPPFFRWKWFDTAAVLFFLCFFLSFGVNTLFHQGSFRQSLTMLTQWGGFLGMYFAFRTFLCSDKRIFGMILVLTGLVLGETAVSAYQYFYEFPKNQAEYFADSEPVLQSNGITTPQDRKLFEDRLKGMEPIGTYSLTNSLAGVLVPWGIVIFGLLLTSFRGNVRRTPFLLLGMSLLPILGCLFLTRSRSGWIAMLSGVMLVLVFPFLRQKLSLQKILISLPVVLILLIFGLAAAVSKGGLVTGAVKSFGYRLQYWESTLSMIAERPFWGCGAGNYQQIYTRYKLPEASETIADPHNFLMEIASNTGLPALLLFLILLVNVFSAKTRRKEDSGLPQETRTFSDDVPYFAGGLFGLFAAFMESLSCYAEILPPHFLIGTVGFLMGTGICLPFFRVSNVTLTSGVLKIALAALLINLLAAGGISYPHVSLTLWFLLAVTLNHSMSPEKVTSEHQKRLLRTMAVFFGLLSFLAYNVSYKPNSEAQRLYRDFQFTAASRPINTNISRLEEIVRIDPWLTQAWLDLCGYYLVERQYRQDKAVWTPKIELAVQKTVDTSPCSAAIRGSLGDIFLENYLQTGQKETLHEAVKHYQAVTQLYPNGSFGHAKLAQASLLSGDDSSAQAAAKRAAELDDITPHSDRKLPAELRGTVEKLLKRER
ncbi:MAG: O-antigen ligase family protein [Planctomycetaceae bacterium]|jgi:hypothetical protein|nr:O-antigen ligase family protein [Planctomycetaceae bacterium]